ncbi:hypothetical protein FQN50_001418 [Emmonsiellopsis sp. PD_5]|nr:hypothetical protein FQN50_001418 [Emmonsiellopsis sp. PD_5]
MSRLSSKNYIRLHALFQFLLAVYLTNCREVITDAELVYNVNDVVRIDAKPTFSRPRSPLAYCGIILITFALFDLILAIKLPLINQIISMSQIINHRADDSPAVSAAVNKVIRVFSSLFFHICVLLALTRLLVFSVISLQIYSSAPEIWMPAGMQSTSVWNSRVNEAKNKVVLGYGMLEIMSSAWTLLSLKAERRATEALIFSAPMRRLLR